MIETDLQYTITKRAAEKFRTAIAAHPSSCPDGIDPILFQAHLDGMREQADDLEAEMRDFDLRASVPVADTQEIPY